MQIVSELGTKPVHVVGTLAELRTMRSQWATMTNAVADLSNMGYGNCLASDLTGDLADLGETLFGVPLPCLVCQQEQLVEVQVGDPARTEPTVTVCEECGDSIRLLIAEQGRRAVLTVRHYQARGDLAEMRGNQEVAVSKQYTASRTWTCQGGATPQVRGTEMTSSRGYETAPGSNGETLYLIGDVWVTEAEARAYAQDEADALAATGDPAAYEGYPAAIAPQRQGE